MLPPPPNSQQELSLSLCDSSHTFIGAKLICYSTMKQNFHSFAILLFLVFLISTPHTSARKLAAKQGEANVKINNISSSKKSVAKMKNIDSFSELMGLDECQNEDEECLKRRVVAEAHLDYIYTQHHKP